MDKNIWNLAEMYRETIEKPNHNGSFVPIPSCINNDVCKKIREESDNGILTMAFVNIQPLENVYPPETAFLNGTLFPNINKPFYGGKRI